MNQYKILSSPLFLITLALLLANDFFFKPIFHNWMTGKISDFAGLFLFPLFWSSVVPKYKNMIFVATAIGFVFWKSPFSQDFIDFWNRGLFGVLSRVVDYSDFIALVMLPIAYCYQQKEFRKVPGKVPTYLVGAFCIFAFCATSRSLPVDIEYSPDKNHYYFPTKPEITLKAIDKFEGVLRESKIWHDFSEQGVISRVVKFTHYDCLFDATATIQITSYTGGSRIYLKNMECLGKYREPVENAIQEFKRPMVKTFEEKIITFVKKELSMSR